MRDLKHWCWFPALTFAIAMASTPASAQQDDTLSISGTFHVDSLGYPGYVGDDLLEVFTSGNDYGWTLTLHGVTYSHDYRFIEWNDEWGYGYQEEYYTRVHATSFDLQFFGPDADILDEVVSGQLTRGSLAGGACLELWNGDYLDSEFPEYTGQFGSWDLGLLPDSVKGVSYYCAGYWSHLFPADEDGYPLIEPQRVLAYFTTITDRRLDYDGGIVSFDDPVDIGSSEPPVIPLTMSIADASAREGNRGTTWLDLTVSLSRYPDDVVTVDYETAAGTARNKSDYTATSGTLLFWPDEISQTISIAIKADRKHEADETLFVELSNAAGATIADGVATGTILNDD